VDAQENPYQSPQTTDGHVTTAIHSVAHAELRPYESGHTRAVWAIVLFALLIPLHLLSMGADLLVIRLVHQVQQGVDISDSEAAMIDGLAMVINLLLSAVWLAAFIAFLIWIHRACRNLPALGAKNVRFTPGWAVGYFFIPILNVYVPYQVVKEIWCGSDPGRLQPTGNPSGSAKPASTAIIGWWWAFWIACIILGKVLWKTDTETQDGILISSWTGVYAGVADILKALLTLGIVWRTDKHQEQRHAMILQESEIATDEEIGVESTFDRQP
jgi:hypothetical protein